MSLCHSSCANLSAVVLTDAWRSIDNSLLGDDSSLSTAFSTPSPMEGHATLEEASWYTFAGDAGARLLGRAPYEYHFVCSYHDGWLRSTHPAPGDPLLDATVCFTESSYPATLDLDEGACEEQVAVQVCACEEAGVLTYSYKLPEPPSQHTAYCSTAAPVPPPPLSLIHI